jgi:protein kinase C substrate 80K-H
MFWIRLNDSRFSCLLLYASNLHVFVGLDKQHDIVCFSDCCDGSDEYESSIHCPNTCIMGGNVNYIYKPRANLKSIHLQLGSTPHPKEFYTIGNLQDMVKNLQGMKLVFALQMVFIGFLVILWMLRSRARSKRRRYLLKNVPPINRSAN